MGDTQVRKTRKRMEVREQANDANEESRVGEEESPSIKNTKFMNREPVF